MLRDEDMEQADKTRLEKLLGMLGSAFDGERANAARMIGAMAEKHKCTINELIGMMTGPAP
jgi:hydroxylamine reductase (hybrid-cluster protein)